MCLRKGEHAGGVEGCSLELELSKEWPLGPVDVPETNSGVGHCELKVHTHSSGTGGVFPVGDELGLEGAGKERGDVAATDGDVGEVVKERLAPVDIELLVLDNGTGRLKAELGAILVSDLLSLRLGEAGIGGILIHEGIKVLLITEEILTADLNFRINRFREMTKAEVLMLAPNVCRFRGMPALWLDILSFLS